MKEKILSLLIEYATFMAICSVALCVKYWIGFENTIIALLIFILCNKE